MSQWWERSKRGGEGERKCPSVLAWTIHSWAWKLLETAEPSCTSQICSHQTSPWGSWGAWRFLRSPRILSPSWVASQRSSAWLSSRHRPRLFGLYGELSSVPRCPLRSCGAHESPGASQTSHRQGTSTVALSSSCTCSQSEWGSLSALWEKSISIQILKSASWPLCVWNGYVSLRLDIARSRVCKCYSLDISDLRRRTQSCL